MNDFYYKGISGPAYDLKELKQKLELIVNELDVIINRMNDDLELAHYIPGIVGYIPSIPMSLQEECECEKRDIPEVPC